MNPVVIFVLVALCIIAIIVVVVLMLEKRKEKTHNRLLLKRDGESKQKMRDSAKDIHAGKNNSQYGTFWITNGCTNMKWSSSRGDIPTGYRRGRVM